MTSLSAKELSSLENALAKHLALLDDLLARPDIQETDIYLLLACQLRVLLCDSDIPILLTYSREKNIPLHVWGPRQLPQRLLQGLTALIAIRVASWVQDSPQS